MGPRGLDAGAAKTFKNRLRKVVVSVRVLRWLTWGGVTDNVRFAMLAALEKLLILQDRDRKVTYLKVELSGIEPQRQMIRMRTSQAQTSAEAGKLKLRQLEAERKELELEVEAKKQQIERYSLQQYQTKKNEEYRALAHEIDMAREEIRKLEDRQLDLMEQAEAVHRQATEAARVAQGAQLEAERQLASLISREDNLRKELARLEADRGELLSAVDAEVLARYERLRKSKGERVVVGVDHGACGGCHMRLPAQVLITCQAEQEIPTCPNCGRVLYYTRDMSLAAAE